MMFTRLTPAHFFLTGVFFLVADIAIHLLVTRSVAASPSKRWHHLSHLMAFIALLSTVMGLALPLTRGRVWPLQAAPEVIIASIAAAMLWHLVNPGNLEWKWEALFYLIVAILAAWGIMQWPSMQMIPMPQTAPQFWAFISHLTLALAYGAFIHAGTANLAYLLTEKSSRKAADEEISDNAMLVGLPFLSVSLLLTGIAGLYTRGVYWEWNTAGSCQLLTWLFYAMMWCAWAVLGWRGRRISVLSTLGMVLILLMLCAI